jgi:hypothetical protein
MIDFSDKVVLVTGGGAAEPRRCDQGVMLA